MKAGVATNARWGRLPDLTVREWLTLHAARIGRLPLVLISSVDSERCVAAMPWAIARSEADPRWALSRSPLVVSGGSVVRLLDEPTLFTGFDELWIPAHLPADSPSPEVYLVGPRALDEESPAAVLDWVADSGCLVGVGDGCGLNFVLSDLALGRELGLA